MTNPHSFERLIPAGATSNWKHVKIYSDGACRGNPGPGGWAALLICGNAEREISGGAAAATNNQMELRAAIEALSALNSSCHVDFYTDSAYLRNGVLRWIGRWRERGWITNGLQPVKNLSLWKQLDSARSRHFVHWHWVKGHSDNAFNLRCDRLAKREIANINRNHSEAELRHSLHNFYQAQAQERFDNTVRSES
jgi:ribonuclease HI